MSNARTHAAPGPAPGPDAVRLPRPAKVASRSDPLEREADRLAARAADLATASGSATTTDSVGTGIGAGSGVTPSEAGTSGPPGGSGVRRGRPVPPAVLRWAEPGLGDRFDDVRFHDGPGAWRANRRLGALAFTHGTDVYFGPGVLRPATSSGRRLIAHELAHVRQQRHSTEPIVHRAGLIDWIGGLFAGEDFSAEELHAYLRVLRETGAIQDNTDSDNKARALVRAWSAGDDAYILTPSLVVLLIQEMLSGATLGEDEAGILTLLDHLDDGALAFVFGNGVDVDRLLRKIDGDNHDRLVALLDRRFAGGVTAVRAGTLSVQGAPTPRGVAPVDHADGDRIVTPACDVMHPEHCHVYEEWLAAFSVLGTFDASSGHAVIGGGRATATSVTADPAERRPPRLHGAPYGDEDHFIDGPTEAWVRANLPPHLVATAYQLRSDCADIAVILRHVWLVAHRRTEHHRSRQDGRVWLLGNRLADPRTQQLERLLTNQVWTGSVDRIVHPYRDERGDPIRSWLALRRIIQPGDVLVWDHTEPNATGHAHTVMSVERDDGAAVRLRALQGNQPIFSGDARRIAPGDAERQRRLRNAPGRRIEVSRLPHRADPDVAGVWTWGDGTTVLVAAGPPVAAAVPAARTGRSARTSGLGDWTPQVTTAADLDQLQSIFEAAVLDTRALVLSGRPSGLDQAEAFGRATGGRLWTLAKEAARERVRVAERRRARRRAGRVHDDELLADDLGAESHFRPLDHLLGMLAALGRRSGRDDLRGAFARIAAALERSGRGIDTVSFPGASSTPTAKVLVTGFDPFAFGAVGNRYSQIAPSAGQWNPSGAAVLALDGEVVPAGSSGQVAVEGVVLPVSYRWFRAGNVEALLGAHVAEVDAVITVSMADIDPGVLGDPTAAPGPVRLERYVVGVHQLNNGVAEPVPVHGTPPAAPILTAQGLDEVVAGSGLGGDDVTIGLDITFDFTTVGEAERAAAALGVTATGTAVELADPAKLSQIVRTMEPGLDGAGLTFRVGSAVFQARVVRGPGGSFLSNEVSYRTLRRLAAAGRADVASFHVHTPRGTASSGGAIPQDTVADEQRAARLEALDLARRVRAELLTTLRALIAAAGRRALDQRQGTP